MFISWHYPGIGLQGLSKTIHIVSKEIVAKPRFERDTPQYESRRATHYLNTRLLFYLKIKASELGQAF
jgi:hypothetical protein